MGHGHEQVTGAERQNGRMHPVRTLSLSHSISIATGYDKPSHKNPRRQLGFGRRGLGGRAALLGPQAHRCRGC